MDAINVYLDSSTTPLPLLTTETAWLGGRLIRIRGKPPANKEKAKYACMKEIHRRRRELELFIINFPPSFAAKDDKSPARASERLSVTAPPSRKASAVSTVSTYLLTPLFSFSIFGSTTTYLFCLFALCMDDFNRVLNVQQSGRTKSRLFNPSSSSADDSSSSAAAASSSAFLSTSFGGLNTNPQQSLSALNLQSQGSFDATSLLLRGSSVSGAGSSGTGTAATAGLTGSRSALSVAADSKANKAANRWSGLWGSSAKVRESDRF